MAADVSVHNLSKRYGPVEALRGISFEVATGEIFGLLGPNGAGKTSALECLLGLRAPDAGMLRIGGIDAVAEADRVRPFTGAQLQAAALQDKITAREALVFAASFYAQPVAPSALLERFRLQPVANQSFDSLSGGQQQRVLLALAFINAPRLVVLDEPTAGLDPHSRRELHGILRELHAEGCTILLSTHQLDEAEQLCDRIGILHAGRLVANAPPAELVAAARALPRVSFRTAQPLPEAAVRALPGAADALLRGQTWSVTTAHPGRTVTALTQLLEPDGNALLDLQVQRPTLEDVFIELTGQAWVEPAAADAPVSATSSREAGP